MESLDFGIPNCDWFLSSLEGWYWDIGYKVGYDVIIGCEKSIFLSKDLMHNFHLIGKVTLNTMENVAITKI